MIINCEKFFFVYIMSFMYKLRNYLHLYAKDLIRMEVSEMGSMNKKL